MILSIVTIGIVGVLAYLWSSRGLFSAMIHFACVLVAGAIAFAAWEPLTYGLLLGLPRPMQEMAFSLGLIAPFLVAVLLLRLVCDKVVRANLDFDDATNFVGGLLFGALTGVIASGFLVLSLSFLRLPPDFMGYKAADYDSNGSLVKGKGLILPVDRMTVGFYEFVSKGAFATSTPLAVRSPDVDTRAALVRYTFGGKGRTSLTPDDFAVVARYTVKDQNILTDSLGAAANQSATMLDKSPYPPGSTLEGFVLRFGSATKEKDGKVVFGPGQISLVCATADGDAIMLQPVAVVSRADPSALDLGRWRFDGKEIFISSVGGGAEWFAAFEFVVPPGATPSDLYVRHVRVSPESGGAPTEFASVAERDDAVRSRTIFEGDTTVEAPRPGREGPRPVAEVEDPIRRWERLPGTMNKSNRGGLEVDADNYITGGQATMSREALQDRTADTKLRVDRFRAPDQTHIVQVDVSLNSRVSLFGKAMDAAETVAQPLLVDNLGQVYQPVGWVYDDGVNVNIRFTPGNLVRALSEIPSLSRSRSNEKLILIFTPSAGVQIVEFRLGNQTIEKLDPPLTLPAPRSR